MYRSGFLSDKKTRAWPICKDLVSWVARKQQLDQRHWIFVKIAVFCWNIFNENIAKLVIDNAACEKL